MQPVLEEEEREDAREDSVGVSGYGPMAAIGQACHGALFRLQAGFASWLSGGRPGGMDGVPGELLRALPGPRAVLAAARALEAEQRRRVQRGDLAFPVGWKRPFRTAMPGFPAFLADLPVMLRRRRAGRGTEVRERDCEEDRALPPGFRLNFHYQSDGYLSEASALLYDQQVEILFLGAAQAMRRSLLLPLLEHLDGWQDTGVPAGLVDVACGTAPFLAEFVTNHPGVPVVGVDLSRPWLDCARRRLKPLARRAAWVQADSNQLPFADGSVAALACIFLFHELSPRARRQTAAEFARVLAPGGRLFFLDALQPGDVPAFGPLLELFPFLFFEPFFRSYLEEDLEGVFAQAGLRTEQVAPAFLSRMMIAVR